jgi:hypothetical protein
MNLEAVEQRCLSYLRETTRLLVPVSELLRILDQDEDTQGMDESRLVPFLHAHELFSVIEPDDIQPRGAAMQSEMDLIRERAVCLVERVPSNDQVLASMADALTSMMQALETGTDHARKDANPERALEVQNILKRAREIRMKMMELGRPDADAG